MAFPVCLKLSIDGSDVAGTAKQEYPNIKNIPDDSIACLSYSGGVVGHSSPGHQHGGSQTMLQDITILKKVDETSPLIFEACAKGTPVAGVFTFLHTPAGETEPQTAYTVEIKDSRVSSVSQTSSDARSGSNEVAMESISFSSDQVEILWEKPSVGISWPE